VALLLGYSFPNKLKSHTVIREKLQKTLLYEKAVCEILMKLRPGVNFISNLRAHFATKFWRQKLQS